MHSWNARLHMLSFFQAIDVLGSSIEFGLDELKKVSITAIMLIDWVRGI